MDLENVILFPLSRILRDPYFVTPRTFAFEFKMGDWLEELRKFPAPAGLSSPAFKPIVHPSSFKRESPEYKRNSLQKDFEQGELIRILCGLPVAEFYKFQLVKFDDLLNPQTYTQQAYKMQFYSR